MNKIISTAFIFLLPLLSFSQTSQKSFEKGQEKVKKIERIEAIEHFNEAIELNPNNFEAYFERAKIHRQFQRYPEAIADFNKVVYSSSVLRPEAATQLAEIAYERKNYAEAALLYTKAIQQDSTNWKALSNRGIAYYKLDETGKSLTDLTKASVNYSDSETHFYLALNYIKIKSWKEAKMQLSKAIAIDAQNAEAYLYRGSTYFALAEDPYHTHRHQYLKQALADFTKAIELNNKLEEAYFERGEVYMELKDYKGAIADFKQALFLDPDDLDAHYMKALSNYHYGHKKEAKRELEDILKKDSKFEAALYQLGRIELEDDENYLKAIEYFDRAAKIDETDSNTFLFRGLSKLELGDKGGACRDFKRADEFGDMEAHRYVLKYCSK